VINQTLIYFIAGITTGYLFNSLITGYIKYRKYNAQLKAEENARNIIHTTKIVRVR
jgi:hypothetical protein